MSSIEITWGDAHVTLAAAEEVHDYSTGLIRVDYNTDHVLAAAAQVLRAAGDVRADALDELTAKDSE